MKTLSIRNWAGAAAAAHLSAVAAGALLVCAAVSCKKDAAVSPTQAEGVRTFKATSEAHAGDGKTTLADKVVNWESGDEVAVWGDGNKTVAKYTTEENGPSANFTCATGSTAASGDNFYAIYPHSAVGGNAPDGTGWKISLPQYQLAGQEGTFGSGCNPMAAVSNKQDVFMFKNLCGVLRLRLKGEQGMSVRYIKVTTKDAGKSLWGNGEVTFGTDAHSLTMTDGGDGSVYLVNTSSVNIGEGKDVEFDIVLPAKSLKDGFTAEIHCSYAGRKGVFNMSASNATGQECMIKQNTVTEMAVRELSQGSMASDAVLPGKFTVDAGGTQVQFSSGNLQCRKRDASITDWSMENVEWVFAENQYGTLEGMNEDVGENYSKRSSIGLFGWGTTGQDYHFHPEEPNPEIEKEGEDPAWPTCYFPWNTDNASTDSYGPQYLLNGGSDDTHDDNLSVKFKSDWGCNMGSEVEGKNWRVLTGGNDDEWQYVLNERGSLCAHQHTNALKDLVTMSDDSTPHGLFIYPDGYWGNAVGVNNGGPSSWNEIDARGIVFLPAAGARVGPGVKYFGTTGTYWSSTAKDVDNAFHLNFNTKNIYVTYVNYHYDGFSVRLVKTLK